MSDDGANTQQAQERLDEALKALSELNEYGFSLLKRTEGKPYKFSRRRHVYLVGLFASALAQVQGYICLADNKQYRVSHNQTRTLYEIWVNTRFLYCSRSNVYTLHMIVMSDKRKVERAAILLADGHITQDEYDAHEKTYLRRKAIMAKRYPAWPDIIPRVISGRTAPADADRLLDLRQRCIIIDFYNAKYKRVPRKAMKMEAHYASLYPFFSSGTHADPLELSSIFTETGTHVYANIDGSNDVAGAARMTDAVYAFQYELVSYIKRYVMMERKPKMPSWIDVYARQIGLIK